MIFREICLNGFDHEREYTIPKFRKVFELSIDSVESDLNHEFTYQSPQQNFTKDVVKLESIDKLETRWRDVFHIKFDKVVDFKPGDSIGLRCKNDIKYVLEAYNLIFSDIIINSETSRAINLHVFSHFSFALNVLDSLTQKNYHSTQIQYNNFQKNKLLEFKILSNEFESLQDICGDCCFVKMMNTEYPHEIISFLKKINARDLFNCITKKIKNKKIKLDKMNFDVFERHINQKVSLSCLNRNPILISPLNFFYSSIFVERRGIYSKLNNYSFEGTLYQFFTHVFDFKSIPKKAFLNALKNQILLENSFENSLEKTCNGSNSTDIFRSVKNNQGNNNFKINDSGINKANICNNISSSEIDPAFSNEVRIGNHNLNFTEYRSLFSANNGASDTLKRINDNEFDNGIKKLSKCRSESQFQRIKSLNFLISKDGSKSYLTLYSKSFSLLEIFSFFQIKPRLDMLLEYCEPIKIRYFSLINHALEPTEVMIGSTELTTNVAHSNKNYPITIYGHTTQFFRDLMINKTLSTPKIEFCIRENKLLRYNLTKNALCIATGTGIAPFLSFIHSVPSNRHLWILYGCRDVSDNLLEYYTKTQNYSIDIKIYTNDLYDFSCNGTFPSGFTEPENPTSQKTLNKKNSIGSISADVVLSSQGHRVTNFLCENQEKIQKYIENNCQIYVCGNLEMQKSVNEIFKLKFVVPKDTDFSFDNWS